MVDTLNGDAVTAIDPLSWPHGSLARGIAFARRLGSIHVSPSDNLQTKLNAANAGDTLILADGTYQGSGRNVLEISKDITIRAQNFGQAILDGQNARRVIYIASGTVTLEGLDITRGFIVRGPCPAALWNLRRRSCTPSPDPSFRFSPIVLDLQPRVRASTKRTTMPHSISPLK